MELWKIALFLLALVWALQCVGTWRQMRHFRSVMGAVAENWNDGRVGAGNARGRLGKGVIAVVVIDPQERLRRVMLMEGRSVLAKFVPQREWEGQPLAALRQKVASGEMDAGQATALGRAIDQLDKVPMAEAEAQSALA